MEFFLVGLAVLFVAVRSMVRLCTGSYYTPLPDPAAMPSLRVDPPALPLRW